MVAPDRQIGVSTGAWIIPDPATRADAISAWNALPDFASVNFSEEGAYEVAQILLKKNVGVEAGVCDANAAERFVDSGLASRCLRVLLEPQEQEIEQARVTVTEIKEVLDRAKNQRRASFRIALPYDKSPYTSKSGMKSPCRAQVRAVMNRIAKAFGGTVDKNNQIKLPTASISYDKMEETMKRLGFTEFTNENILEHRGTYALGYGAYHWEGNVGGNWYHLNFPRTGFLSDTVRLAPDAHYEVDRSDSINHRNATGQRTKCQ